MIKTLLFATLLGFSFQAAAASPNWSRVDGSGEHVLYADYQNAVKSMDVVAVWAIKSYSKVIDLGNVPESGERLYPHRSAKVRYTIDCSKGTVSLDAWRLYGGNLGDGELVWADHDINESQGAAATSGAEKALVNGACSSNTALQN